MTKQVDSIIRREPITLTVSREIIKLWEERYDESVFFSLPLHNYYREKTINYGVDT